MTAKELILKYWHSWQEPPDFDEMQSCLADNVSMNMGVFHANSSDEFRAIVTANPTPWRDVKLLESVFTPDSGSLLYEGLNTGTGKRTRVAELLRVKGGKIAQVHAVIAELPPK